MLLVTANLGRGVGTEEFLANVRALDEEAGAGAIIGFQEIDEDDAPDEHAGLRQVFGKSFGFVGWGTRVPIAYGPKWRVRRDRIIKAARGLFRLSPERVIDDVVFVHDSDLELAVLDVHFPRNDVRLLSRWRSVKAKLRRRIRYHHRRGRTVVYLGDFNRAGIGCLHPLERTLAHDGLDYIRVVEHPDGLWLHRIESGSIDLTIDGHDAQWARCDLHAPSRPTREHR